MAGKGISHYQRGYAVYMNRCKWGDLKNPKYLEYHDKEWGVLRTDDSYLFEMLVLESFQAVL